VLLVMLLLLLLQSAHDYAAGCLPTTRQGTSPTTAEGQASTCCQLRSCSWAAQALTAAA
jgi:hypothetical protein